MRLGQLARQLSIKPDDIVKFLGSQNIAIDNSNNARIDDSHVELILQRFAPNNESLKQQVSELPELPEAEPESPLTMQDIQPPETSEESIPDLIKAPKIELPGLRVLGKIDLPEKKKPEPQAEEEQKERLPVSPRRIQRNTPPRGQRNSIALAREQDEREKKQTQEEQREKDKQRKTEFYMKRLRPQPPTKAARIVNEDYAEMPPLEREKPKTLWGRFTRWLNT